MSDLNNATRRSNLAAVGFALVFPTLVTAMCFVVLAEHAPTWQQGVFGLGKLIQFAFPAIWVIWIQRAKIGWKRPRARDVTAGAAQGLVLLAAALALYFYVMKPAGAFDVAAEQIRDKINTFGASTVPRYVALSLFYCILHSLAEEYYWRWFVFAQLRRYASLPAAIVVSGLGFMAHHVIIVGVYFGWDSPWTYFLSLSVAVGGFIWAWMYEKTDSLWGTWMSHALVDTAIFIVGYDVTMGVTT